MQTVQWMIAAITAGFVASVAFLQWRSAQQKAGLDLFERRHEIYETARRAVATIINDSNNFDQAHEIELMQAMERAYFFFGGNVHAYLDQLWKAIGEVRNADKLIKDNPGLAVLGNIRERRREAIDCVTTFHVEGGSLFALYMRFPQTTRLFDL